VPQPFPLEWPKVSEAHARVRTQLFFKGERLASNILINILRICIISCLLSVPALASLCVAETRIETKALLSSCAGSLEVGFINRMQKACKVLAGKLCPSDVMKIHTLHAIYTANCFDSPSI